MPPGRRSPADPGTLHSAPLARNHVSRPSNDNLVLRPRTDFDGPALSFDFPASRSGAPSTTRGRPAARSSTFPTEPSPPDRRSRRLAGDFRRAATSGERDLPRRRVALRARGGERRRRRALRAARIPDGLAGHRARAGRDHLRLRPRENARLSGQGARARGAARGAARACSRSARAARDARPRRASSRSRSASRPARARPFRQIGETRVAVFTVVNAVGAIVDREGNVVRGHLDAATGTRRALCAGVEERLAERAAGPPAAGKHDADGGRRRTRSSMPRLAAHARPPGPRLDGARDPAVPRPRRRRRPLRRVDERRSTTRRSTDRARRRRLGARVGRRPRSCLVLRSNEVTPRLGESARRRPIEEASAGGRG